MAQTSTSTVKGHPGVPLWMPNANEHRKLIAQAVNRLGQGKFDVTLDVTLNANTGATVIADNRIGFTSAVTPLMAMSLSAAVAIATGIYFDAPSAGAQATTASIVAHHNINAATDKKIRFGIIG